MFDLYLGAGWMGAAARTALARAVRLGRGMRSMLQTKPGARHGGAVRSVLVLEYMLPLGYLVHMTPVFEAFKRGRPEMTVTVATRELGLDVLRHSPFVDHLIGTPDPLSDLGGAVISLKRQLQERGLQPECCLTGTADQRTKIALLGMQACAGWCGGFAVVDELYQRPLRYNSKLSRMSNNLRLAEMLGFSSEGLEPKIFFTAKNVAIARRMLRLAGDGTRPVLVVVPCASGGLPTCWHDERWAKVVRHAHGVLGYDVIYVGREGDRRVLEHIRELAGGVGYSIAGMTNVSQLAAVMALSDMVAAITTGAMHVGRAVRTPMVVLGPAWEKPLEWMAQGRESIRLLRGTDREDRPAEYRMDEISPGLVSEALDEMTSAFPANEEARDLRLAAGLSEVDLMRGVRRQG